MATSARALQPWSRLLHRFLDVWPLVGAALLVTALMFVDVEKIERSDEI